MLPALDGAAPAARLDQLVTTRSGNELLIYDVQRHEIHHLNEVSAAVWHLLDGRRTLAGVASEARVQFGVVVSEDSVQLAIAKLAAAGLLDGPIPPQVSGAHQTRRGFLRKAGIAGAMVVPAIVSVTAATAASNGSITCRQGRIQWPEACKMGNDLAAEGDCCCDDWSNGPDPGCGTCSYSTSTDPNAHPVCIGAN